ncbi:MAG: nitrous oxide reductase family maturation protein NosD [Promethearchaeota archaeon]
MDAGGSGSGILVNNSDVYFIIRNCTIYNSRENLEDPGAGISLLNVNNSIIINNNCSKNEYGIALVDSNYNLISNNIVCNINSGIILQGSSKNTVTKNSIFNCTLYGICAMYSSDNNLISENIVKNCSDGVIIVFSLFNQIVGNKLCFNKVSGVVSLISWYNNISWNILYKNRDGILLYSTNDTIVKGNIITGSLNFGINLTNYMGLPLPCCNNLIYANYFKNNKIHAINTGFNNAWDNGIIGNYWDNYTGNDRGDGIGDVSHFFSAGIDFFPIFENPFHNGEKIHIDDTGVSSRDWLLTSLMKAWCRGEGSKEIPYVIENLIINGSGTGSCITIGNSSVNCRIENCKVFNSGENEIVYDVDAGIKLMNVNNGILIENNCSYNNHTGIFLKNCLNVTINNCTASYNRRNGIFLTSECNFNIISGNTVYNNINTGIILTSDCTFNTISGNTVYNNTNTGIYLYNCINNTISGNTLDNIRFLGIHIQSSHDTNITGNYIYRTGINGFDGRAIYVNYGNNNNISGNHIYFSNPIGIYIYEGENNTISNNEIKENRGYAIFLYKGVGHNITKNTMTGCGLGIAKDNSMSLPDISSNYIDSENTVNGKKLYYYAHKKGLSDTSFSDAGQIFLINCSYSTISDVNVSRTSAGITLYYSENNTIKRINATFNQVYGIELWRSDKNNITESLFIDNDFIGVSLDYDSDDNLIYTNIFINNTEDNALDNGNNNKWDNGTIGNYWDDYSGCDSNNDGIGETPYDIPGNAETQDNYPITNKKCSPSIIPSEDDDDDDDEKEDFEINEFLMSPTGLTIIIGLAVVAVIIIIIKVKGSGKSRLKEIERIEKLRSE